ncbi:DUF4190 domain-containing protein [Streptomyces laurentii]|uniref:DUF4190 domain-containing protein n=1 Tax=Streptomyces laurentii TaxID=39478 RepID=UPI003674A5A8
MSENNDTPVDPWAPPNRDGVELSKPATPATPAAPATPDTPAAPATSAAPGAPAAPAAPATPATPAPGISGPPSVHEQLTMASGVEIPPPPVAPGGTYGYPAAPTPPAQPGSPTGYGYPPAPPAATFPGGYGTTSGYPAYGAQPGWGPAPSNGQGTAAMVLGIIAVAGFCLYGLGVVLGVLALIFGILGLKKANRGEATNRGMAIAGIVLGSIGALISAAFVALVVVAAVTSYSDADTGWGENVEETSMVLEVQR